MFKEICQSCGMPMKEPSDFGTNSDGRQNREYCNFCFQLGKFTDEGITMQGKIDKLVGISKEKLGMSESQARQMANSIIPTLKRWK